MPRSIGKCPTRPAGATPHRNRETIRCKVEVVTPLFGGGTVAGKPDPLMPVRPTSIRGHLRFWWRATRGARFATTEELRARETEIFGDTKNPSKVLVEVTIDNAGQSKPCAALSPGRSFPRFSDKHPSYALFPFQGNATEGVPIGEALYGVRFSLTVLAPSELLDDVDTALRAWLSFGGLGARTRRGCGSLFCHEYAPPRNATASFYWAKYTSPQ